MTVANHKLVLIDTNVVLHYRRIDEIDWPLLAGAASCTLAITPVLMRELEQHKVHNRSKTLRDRAGRMIDYLVGLMDAPDPILIRPAVTLSFISDEPTLDFASHRLKESIADDHYIATALELAAETADPVLIASADGGMALKLRARPIAALRLPPDLKLPDEPDPAEKELRETKRELLKLQTRQPQLSVRFADGSTLLRLPKRLAVPPPGIKTPDEIRREYPKRRVPGKPNDPRSTGLGTGIGALGLSQMADLGGFASARIERENSYLDLYYLKYETYYEQIAAHWDWLSRSYELALVLHNEGAGPATIVEAQLSFSGQLKLGLASDVPEKPDEPSPPKATDVLGPSGPPMSIYQKLGFPEPPSFHDGRPLFDDGDHDVYFDARNLRPKSQFALDQFVVTFASLNACAPLEIAVTIRCNELEPVSQKLAIVFDPPPST